MLDTRIAVAPGPIEPLEGCLRVVPQRVDFRDLVGGTTGILLDKCPERRIGRTPVAPDLPGVDERHVPIQSGRGLLRGLERRRRVIALSLDDS